jgi:hypothetical protein
MKQDGRSIRFVIHKLIVRAYFISKKDPVKMMSTAPIAMNTEHAMISNPIAMNIRQLIIIYYRTCDINIIIKYD